MKLKLHTPDLTAANVERIAALFPNCVTEATDEAGKLKRAIDFDLLKQELSADLVEGPQERYRLDWPGKREALALANTPVALTLRPCRGESVDFENTKNLYIEGDNLDALKLLQETYLGKVKMIYIDPPYNTGNDFIYEDDFTAEKESYQRGAGEKDVDGNRMIDEERWRQNTANNGRFHSDWLSMIYPRLKLARNLLSDVGVIFISIGDDEVSSLRNMCSEIFGSENFVAMVTRIAKRTSDKGTHFRPTKDNILVYAKAISELPEFGVKKEPDIKEYNLVEKDGRRYKQSGASLYQPSLDSRPNQRYYIEAPDGSMIIPPGNIFPSKIQDGEKIKPLSNSDKVWRWSVDTYMKQKHLLIFTQGSAKNPLLDEKGNQSKWNIYPKVYFDDDVESTLHPEDVIYEYPNSQGTKELNALGISFSFGKPSGLIAFLLKVIIAQNCIILDFFSGSATTAHAVMQLNAEDGGKRRHIMVQLPEPCDSKSEAFKAGYKTIAEIGKERIRRAGKKILAEWQAKQAKEKPAQGDLLDPSSTITDPPSPPDIGFRVLKIDDSNMKDVYYAPDDVKQSDLVAHADNLKKGRTHEDLLFQVLVDWGVDLALSITQEIVHGKTIFFVDGNALVACFDPQISEELVKNLAKRQPLRVVFRDGSYGDDSAKINVEQIFKHLSPGTEVKSL
jgi:adenine-specific DNA-methyltransferase